MIDLIYGLHVTEKSMKALEKTNTYTFKIDPRLTKPTIKTLIQEIYSVKVKKVNTHIRPRKKRRIGYNKVASSKRYKLALVRIEEGDSIPVFPE